MEQNTADWVYVRRDGTPRNWHQPEVEMDMEEADIEAALTRADVEAFKRTQRWLALGITAVGGTLANVLNQPEDISDFVGNMSIPATIQALNYITFRKGVGLMRRRVSERRQA